MEAVVDQSEEVGHAEEWLEVEPEEKRKALGDRKDDNGDRPVRYHALV